MRKLGGILFLSLWACLGWAQDGQSVEEEGSSLAYIIIGAILLIIIIIILYNKQKRKFNH
jgi:membrane protein DedA with SNARE-associated domain